jgi:xylulokinase
VLLLGGAARSPAVQHVATTVFDAEVVVPEPGEYVALGSGVQVARAVAGGEDPGWASPPMTRLPSEPTPVVRARYRVAADRIAADQTKETRS